MSACDVGLSDLSLRCLSKLDPPSLASWSNLAPVLEALDGAGFHSIEAWGEMTFDHSLRALRVSPWDRLAALSRYITRTPLQLELRGRCLLGSRVYPDDTVKDFIAQASDCGIRSFLIAEPLDDLGGMETVANAVHKVDGRLTMALTYSSALDDPVGSLTAIARECAAMGCEALCLKTAEAVPPRALADLVESFLASISLPVQVHLEAAGGFGPAAAAACVAAGASVVYGTCAPSWLDRSSLGFPALLPVLRDSARLVELDEDAAVAAGIALAGVALRGGEPLRASTRAAHAAGVDWRDLARVPGEVVVQVTERLSTMGAAGHLAEVVAEISRVREELGGPALVPPVAQVIATQAVLNVVYGRRWRMVPDEMRAYLRGEYGEPPRERTVELEHHAGEPTEPVDQQPVPDQAFLLPGDSLLHAVAPLATMEYLERRSAAADVGGVYGPSPAPPESISDLQDRWHDLGPESIRELVALLESSTVDELTVENQGTRVSLRKAAAVPAPETPAPAISSASQEAVEETGDASRAIIRASMVGTFYRSATPGTAPFVEVGSHVDKGDVLCVLEAMKLMNELPSEVAGRVAAVLAEDGTAVEYGQPLFVIELEAD